MPSNFLFLEISSFSDQILPEKKDLSESCQERITEKNIQS
jgi:hypothetical protein